MLQEIPRAELEFLAYQGDPGYIGSDSFQWNGSDGIDYAATPATVSILAEAELGVVITPVRDAVEGGQSGQFRFTRFNTAGPLTVSFQADEANCTATLSDIANLAELSSHSVEFLDGESTAILNVVAANDGRGEIPESVTVVLTDGSGYAVGTPAEATIWIHDQPTVTVEKTHDAVEGGQSGQFAFTRNTTAGSLAVQYEISNSSTASAADYNRSAFYRNCFLRGRPEHGNARCFACR